LIERSNEMSGESFLVMIVRGFSIATSVLNGGNSPSEPQPSSSATRCSAS
jgi:hypothetical protein